MGESRRETWTLRAGDRVYSDAAKIECDGQAVLIVPCDDTAEAEDGAIVETLSPAQKRRAKIATAAPLMLEALRDGDGDTFAGTLEGIANVLVVANLTGHDKTIDWLRNKASAIRAAIKAATGGES